MTDVGVLRINDEPLPRIEGVTVTYDTSSAAIKVTWNALNDDRITGVNIYADVANESVRRNDMPITDRVFLDYGLRDGLYTEESGNIAYPPGDDNCYLLTVYKIVTLSGRVSIGADGPGETVILTIPVKYLKGLVGE